MKLKKDSTDIFFWIFSILPLVTADAVLRYALNPMYMSFFYNIVPILFNVFWIFLVVYTCRYILPKKIGRIIYVVFVMLFGIWFFANFISFKVFSKFLWLKSIFLASEASNYISVVGQYMSIKVVLVTIIYIGSIIITCILWGDKRIENKSKRIIPFVLSIIGVVLVEILMNVAIARDKLTGAWEVWDKPTLVYDKFVDPNKSLNVAGLYQYTFKSIYKAFFNDDKISADMEEETDTFFSENLTMKTMK